MCINTSTHSINDLIRIISTMATTTVYISLCKNRQLLLLLSNILDPFYSAIGHQNIPSNWKQLCAGWLVSPHFFFISSLLSHYSTLNLFRFHIWMRSCSICFSVSALFHLTWCPLVPSMWPQMRALDGTCKIIQSGS